MRNRGSIFYFKVLPVVTVLLMYCAYVASRGELNTRVNVLPLLLSLAIVLLPDVLQQFSRLSISLLQLFVIIFFFVLGGISIFLNLDVSLVIYVTSIIGIYFFIRNLRFTIPSGVWIVGLLAFFLAIKLIYIVWSKIYLNPLAPEAYAIGYIHIDTLYLSNLTSIIKTYHVPSLGAFGLEPIRYHAGSNYLFASLTQLCKLNVIDFYNFCFPVIFIPLFLQCFFYAAFSNFRKRPGVLRIIVCLLILFFGFTGFVNDEIGSRFLIPSTVNSHFLSQSYSVSLILGFLMIAIYAPLIRKRQLHPDRFIHSILILLIPVWFFIIAYIKISTAVILLIGLIYLLIRTKLIFQLRFFISVILTLAILPFVLYVTIEQSDKMFQLDPGSFYKEYISGNIIAYFLLNYFWMILLLVVILIMAKIRNENLYKNILSNKYLPFEMVIVIAVAGILPGLLISIEGGSAIYFSDIQYWIALVVLVNIMTLLLLKYYKNYNRHFPNLKIVTFVFLIIIAHDSVFRGLYFFVKKNIRLRTTFVFDENTYFSLPSIYLGHPTLRLNDSEKFKSHLEKLKLPLLEQLRMLPPDVKKNSVIYGKGFDELTKFLDCTSATFYIASLTEIALINGLYWKDCFPKGEYSMSYYSSFPKEIDEETALKLAKQKGFLYVIFLDLSANQYEMVKL